MAANLQKAGYRLVVNDTGARPPNRISRRAPAGPTARGGGAMRRDLHLPAQPARDRSRRARAGRPPRRHSQGPRLFRDVDQFTRAGEAPARGLRRTRRAMLDAPISGGAAAHSAAGWRSGSAATRPSSSVRAGAARDGDRPVHVGDVGAGLGDQAGAQLRQPAMQAAIAEVFALGVKAGAEPLALWEAIRQGDRAPPHLRRARRSVPARQLRPAGCGAAHHPQGHDARHRPRRASSACRCALPISRSRTSRRPSIAAGRARLPPVMLLPQERVGVKIAVDPARIERCCAATRRLRAIPSAAPTSDRGKTTMTEIKDKHYRDVETGFGRCGRCQGPRHRPPYGPEPMGRLVLTGAGRMMAVLCDGRTSIPEGEKRVYSSYCGNYRVETDTLTTIVDAELWSSGSAASRSVNSNFATAGWCHPSAPGRRRAARTGLGVLRTGLTAQAFRWRVFHTIRIFQGAPHGRPSAAPNPIRRPHGAPAIPVLGSPAYRSGGFPAAPGRR